MLRIVTGSTLTELLVGLSRSDTICALRRRDANMTERERRRRFMAALRKLKQRRRPRLVLN